MKMIVAAIGLKFDSSKPINELSFNLPEGAQILSVTAKNDEPTLNITFIANREIFNSDLWREFEFVICKCNYSEVDLNDQQYVGNVNFGNDSFAVFYKKGLIA